MNYPDFPQEFDWCLHLWQKKSLETVSDVDKPLQEASHFQFIRARDGPEGISCLDEQLLLKKYCDNIDDCNSSGGNHADLIMPVIKNTTADCLKWEYSSLDPLMKALEKSKNVPMKHSFIPSSEALKDIAAGFVEAANTVSSEPHSTNCHISNASDEGKENSRLNVDGGSSSAAYRFTGNPKVLPSASIDSDQSPLGAQQIISNLEQRPDSFIAQRPKTFTSTDDVCRNNYSFKSGRVQNVLKTPSFDLIENSNADFIGGDSKRSRPPEELPRNTQIFGSQQINNESAYRGRGVYPWQAHADRAGPGLKKESGFRTASYQLKLNQMKQGGRGDFQGGYQVPSCPPDEGPYGNSCRVSAHLYGNTERRSLGTRPGSVSSKFIPPVRRQDSDGDSGGRKGGPLAYSDGESNAEPGPYEHLMMDPRLKNIDSKMVELIMNEVLDAGVEVQWDDIAGLQEAKATIQEVVVWPMLRPDIFTGLRGPPKGVLLFGPPGTGKTMIGKAIASQSGATFFSISASCLTSKWVGEGEKMVRALFAVARVKSPSVIFIDEVDSLLCQRSDTEHESSRRIKTEFLVQLDGVGALTEQVLVVGATNRPHELDEAARRRLVKRLYIPLPDLQARRQLVEVLLSRQQHTLTPSDVAWVANNTDGFSGADMASLCSEAAMGPVRDIDPRLMRRVTLDQVRPISITDFRKSVANVRPSVCQDDLELYTQWNAKYGISRALV